MPRALPPTEPPTVSVIVPACNVMPTIAATVRDVTRACAAAGYAAEVLVVDYGSTDATRALAAGAGAMVLTVPAGYGAACRHGIAAATAPILVLLDADASYVVADIHRFIEPLLAGYGLVLGTRRNGQMAPGAMTRLERHLLAPLTAWATRRTAGADVSDPRCGLRALTRAAAERLTLTATGPELATELLAEATRAGLPVTEVPVTVGAAVPTRRRTPHARVLGDLGRRLLTAGRAASVDIPPPLPDPLPEPTPVPQGLPCTMTVVVPVKNGGVLFQHQARHLARMQRRWGLEVLIIDSGSTDGSLEAARQQGFRVHQIAPETYGHGRTRNLGVRLATGDVVCMITHDVLPCTDDWPLRFAEAFEDPIVAGVFGRQVPRSADTPEMFFIQRNYPATPYRLTPQVEPHRPAFGRLLFSDAFSALRRSVALAHPYLDDIPVSEDQVWAMDVLAQGHHIVYEPRAEALHAHRYTFAGLYRRTYLVGQAGEPFGHNAGTTTRDGLRILGDELRYVARHGHLHRLPWLLCYEFVRWWGFQRGRRSGWRPAMPVTG